MSRTIVIAEAGVNHNGSLELAKQLVDAAVKAQADFVKFQTFKAQDLVTEDADKAEYQKTNTGNSDSQYSMLKKIELTEQMHIELIEYCNANNIKFLSTPFYEDASDYLDDKVDLFKIPSGEVTNHPFLKHVAKKKRPIILSTGMADLEEVRDAINVIREIWKSVGYDEKGSSKINDKTLANLTVLHCNTAYPTPYSDVNLLAMKTMKEELDVAIGYSDHTLGIEVSLAATALGAKVIEKHFTLDRNMEGPDHAASLEPTELVSLVSGVNNINEALGRSEKKPTSSEFANRAVARKSLHFTKKLEEGHILAEGDLKAIRPGDGIPPFELERFLGSKLVRNVELNEKLNLKMIDNLGE